MNKFDHFISECCQFQYITSGYSTDSIKPGITLYVSGRTCIVTEILQAQNMTVYEIALQAEDGRLYKARNNGHMFIITEEIMPKPGI